MKIYSEVQNYDDEFCKPQITIRLAEIYYKQEKLEETQLKLDEAESLLEHKDKYAVSLLRGKCYEKQKKFSEAVVEYQKALKICMTQTLDFVIIGNI